MNKSIQDLDITEYEFYAVAPFSDANIVEFTIENDKVLCEDVDFYDLEDKTLLAFKNENCFWGYHNYKVSSDQQSKIMQVSYYQYVKNIINLQSEYPTTIFSFNDSKIIPQSNPDLNSAPLISSVTGENIFRCDVNKFGPYPFYARLNQYRIKNAKILFSLTGTAHLVALESPDENIQFPNAQGVNTVASTLCGILTMIYEWSQCADDPFNSTENIALKAKDFLNGLNLLDIAKEIKQTQVPMRVSRYLNGETNMNSDLNEIKFMTDSLKNYILTTTMYTSLNSLVNNYPINLNITNDKLVEESKYLESYVYQYCVESNIDVSSTNINEIFNNMMKDNRFSANQNADYSNDHIYRSIVKMYFM